MSENPSFRINRIKIEDWSSSDEPYQLYSVVRVPSGAAAGQYLVSSIDNNTVDGTPSALDASISGSWYNFQDSDFNFKDVWIPSYESEMQFDPKVVVHQFGDGYMQRMADGINHLPLMFNVSFKSVTDIEAKSLLAFFEYKGGVGSFKYTPPFPYDTERLFVAKSWRHQFQGWNRHDVSSMFVEVFN